MTADFRTIDKLRLAPDLGGSNAERTIFGRANGGDHPRGGSRSGGGGGQAAGISEQTLYTWRKRFGGLQASDVKRLQAEVENGRLKKLVAERDLEIEVMKEVAAKKW